MESSRERSPPAAAQESPGETFGLVWFWWPGEPIFAFWFGHKVTFPFRFVFLL